MSDNGWISVKDRLPEEKQAVLIIADGESECGLYYTVSLILNNDWFCKDDVLYWQPLPELPKDLR